MCFSGSTLTFSNSTSIPRPQENPSAMRADSEQRAAHQIQLSDVADRNLTTRSFQKHQRDDAVVRA
jgi:hypothetical protein